MDNYEQNNEVSTSYNNNNLKHNYNCKSFYEYIDSDLDKHKFMEKNFRKLEEEQLNQQQHSLNTPFSVKDILNINQTNYYERNDIWKAQEKDRRGHEYNMPELYHQNQNYCPPEYFNQMYPNIPVHSNVDPYWCQEAYHDPKIEEYYNYNPYCHNLYHQNYEPYQEVVPHHIEIEVPPKEDHVVREEVPLHPASNLETKKDAKEVDRLESVPYIAEPLDKLSISQRKNISKFV